jgi:hypothetical protein
VKALRSRYVVAFDASGVAGAALARGLGAPRVRSLAHVALTPGALWPSPFEANLRRPEEVKEALREVARALALGDAGVCLVLPDGVARLCDLDVPADTSAAAFARYRMAPALPYPAEEAVIDVLPLGRGRVLAAAVRRRVLEGYEAAAAEAGLAQDRVDVAPLGALAALARREPPGALTVDLVLGDAAVSLAARVGGTVAAFRNRRRDRSAGEGRRLRAEVERTAALAGGAAAGNIRVLGAGALALVQELQAAGAPAEAGWRVQGEGLAAGGAELAWLGSGMA